MGGLQAWVKQLVLIVLLAGLAEMLLPQTALRRYAHTALGLLVLIAVLVPFLSFVHEGVAWDSAFERLPAVETSSLDEGVRRFREAGARLTLETYRARVEEEAVRAATAVEGVAQAQARAEIDGDARSPRFGTISRIAVTVVPGRAPRAGEVAPVRPVRIGARSEGEPGIRGPEGGGAGLSPEASGRLREAVAAALMRGFDLLRSQVEVRVAGP